MRSCLLGLPLLQVPLTFCPVSRDVDQEIVQPVLTVWRTLGKNMTDAHHTEAQPCRGLPFPEPEDVFAARKGIVQEARRIVAEAGYELSAQNVMTVIGKLRKHAMMFFCRHTLGIL
mmetsp:Transcript_17488/g.49623  ORF Transcript_17488/g.49623 Transcript_17488/m.49623 type:complete len:116 (-) Transcript_17488:1367-1714(-)